MSPITATRTARSDEWATPKWLFDHFDAEFHFTLDACAQPWNAKCARFYTPHDHNPTWKGETVWCNPPYSDVSPWVWLAHLTAQRDGATWGCLVPNAPDTHWWADHVEGKASEVRLLTRSVLPTGRVHFEKSDGWSGRAGFSSAFIVYRPAPCVRHSYEIGSSSVIDTSPCPCPAHYREEWTQPSHRGDKTDV
jgi:phage N-6-adenine-methyltransferase